MPRRIPAFEEHGAQHRLERIRKQRLQAPPAPLGDALAQVEVASQVELLGELGQGVGVTIADLVCVSSPSVAPGWCL